ncbi:MAG: ATP-dependent DNA ligase [Steroidobacteraceae bacterium]
MRRFAALFESIDTTTSTLAKIEALRSYFEAAEPSDAAWATYILIGRRIKRSVGPTLLRTWLYEESALPGWLVEETYGSVGDLAETIALLVASEDSAQFIAEDISLTEWCTQRILPLARQDDDERRRQVVGWWHQLPYRECFLVTKLLTGSLRVGVSRALVTRALEACLDQPRIQIERALIGAWEPSAQFWDALCRNAGNLDIAQPYPFFLASPLQGSPDQLGERGQWLAEWKWDGIRGQVVRRADQCSVWSRGEEIITERFPEIVASAAALPNGTVLDGEVLAGSADRLLPFLRLQQRIGRKKLTAAILDQTPVLFMAYDLLEFEGIDWRGRPLMERRAQLERLMRDTQTPALTLSPAIPGDGWADLSGIREQARARGVEGLMLKQLQSSYGAGRQRGAWWKWKIDPYLFDGVLLYAAPGHGRRSNLYTDYTFGVWHEGTLVPIAKAYSGLSDVEIRRLDAWIRRHTKEKFGIVRSVEPAHVFELAYEGIARSPRHKAGIALRFPRIVRWRTDKPAGEAGSLADLKQVLAEYDVA